MTKPVANFELGFPYTHALASLHLCFSSYRSRTPSSESLIRMTARSNDLLRVQRVTPMMAGELLARSLCGRAS